MRILIVSAGIPFPPIGGGRMRTYQLAKALAARHDVVLAAFSFEGEQYADPDFPVELVTVPWVAPELYEQLEGWDPESAVEAYRRLQFEHEEPWFVSFYESQAMHDAIAAIDRCDVVLFEGTDMARFASALRGAGVPLAEATRTAAVNPAMVLDLMDVHSLIATRGDSDGDRPSDVERTVAFERRAAHACDACLAVSDEEAEAARRLLGVETVEVVENGVDTSYFTPSAGTEPEPGNILLTGTMSYGPNIEGAIWFADEILPTIKAHRPDAVFHIVGANPRPEILALASEDVVVHGTVPDVRPHLQLAEVVVVPLLSGGGTRLKILEAAAAGRPIVSTSLGAEGLDFTPERDLIEEDGAEDLARAVLELMDSPAKASELGVSARAASLRYDWSVSTERLLRVVERLAPEGTPAS